MRSGTPLLLGCGAVAGPLFVAVFLLAGALRPDYDPLRHPVSSLALTGAGWQQIADFVVAGALMTAFAVGVRRVLRARGASGSKPWLVGGYGVGLIGSGVFVTDPLAGYPPGAPMLIVYTWRGVLHDVFAVPIFLGFPVLCVVMCAYFARRRRWVWLAGTAATAAVFTAGFVFASLGFEQQPGLAEFAGAYQRLAIVLSSAWFTLFALHLYRLDRAPTAAGPAAASDK